MRLHDKFILSCKLVMATPFVVLMVAGLLLAGTNLLILFTDKRACCGFDKDGSC
jgi:hypothetical protein